MKDAAGDLLSEPDICEDRRGIGDEQIDRVMPCETPHLLDRLPSAGLVPPRDEHPRTGARETDGGVESDPSRATRDQGRLRVQALHGLLRKTDTDISLISSTIEETEYSALLKRIRQRRYALHA